MKGKENAALYTAYHTKTEEVMAEVENGLANIKAGIEDKAFDEFYMAMKGTIEAPLSSKTYKKAVQMLEDKARQQAKTFATNLTEAQLNTMAQTIADGLKEGLGTQQISRRLTMVSGLDSGRAATYQKYIDDLAKSGVTGKRLQRLSEKRFNQLLKDRRWTIAQTEARVATSHAREKEAQAFGAKYKVWMTVGDDRVSEQCRANQSEGPIPLKNSFSSGHSGPPAHPGCRCTLGFAMSQQQADLLHKEIEEMPAGDQITQTPVEKPKPKTIKIKQEKINGAIEQLNKTIPDIQVGADAAIQPEAGGIIGRQEWGIKPFAQENTLIESRSTAKVIGELSREIYSDESILRMELQDNRKEISEIKKSIASGQGNNFYPGTEKSKKLKATVCQRLSKATGYSENECSELLKAWAESSTEGTSSLTQKAAENLYGIKYGAKLSDYHAIKFKAQEALLSHKSIDVGEKIKRIENILTAMYEETQRELARRGIKTIKLLRGTGEIKEYAYNAIMQKGKTIQTKLGPLQSFTSSPIVAQGFKNIMIICEVPAERILSMPTTGMGCWHESEYVVIGDGSEEFGYVVFQ